LNTVITVVTALLVFGFLIFIHEFGHYITARLFKVRIDEFSVGMGPRLLWYDSKRTGIRYSLSMIPIGGFVAMPGENGELSPEELAAEAEREQELRLNAGSRIADYEKYRSTIDTFDKKPAWQRFIITAAGAFVNIVIGFIFVGILTLMVNVGDTTVAQFQSSEPTWEYEVSSESTGLRVGDKIISVDGRRVRILDELSYEIMRKGNEPVDLVVDRDGERITLYDVIFPTDVESGQTFGIMDFKVKAVKKTFGSVVNYSFSKSVLIVRMCWESIIDLISGRYSFEAVSGPVGISTAIGDAASAGPASLIYIIALISINLGFMNLLPIPALDGGRLLTLIIEMVTRKKLPPKVEGLINGIGLILLLGLSVVVLIKDVFQLIF
jgi:regulator of sigma E protease